MLPSLKTEPYKFLNVELQWKKWRYCIKFTFVKYKLDWNLKPSYFWTNHTMRILLINFTEKISWQLLTFWFFGFFFPGAFIPSFFQLFLIQSINLMSGLFLFFPTITCILRYLISPNNDMSISFVFTAESIGIYCFKNSCLLLSED